MCTDADAQALDSAIGAWLAATTGAHPAADGDGDGDGQSARRVRFPGAKTNEPQVARAMLDRVDLTDITVTADALHTVKATAEVIHQRGGQFVFPVKENRRALFDALDRLSWTDVPIAHCTVDKGHGRVTRRTIQVLPAPADLPFPHVNQVRLVERYVTAAVGTAVSAVAQLGVASHTATQADPADLACYVQEHWAVEVLHWIRDTCYREDNSTIRTRSGVPGSWPRYATWLSVPYAWPDAATSPRPPDGPAET